MYIHLGTEVHNLEGKKKKPKEELGGKGEKIKTAMADEGMRFEALENELVDLESSMSHTMHSFKVEDLIDNPDETEAAIRRTRSSISLFKDKFSEIVWKGVLQTPQRISDLQFKLAKIDYTFDKWNTNFHSPLRAKHAFSASEGEDAFDDDDDDEEIKNDAIIASGTSSGVIVNSVEGNSSQDDEEIKKDAIITSGSSSGVIVNSVERNSMSQDDEKKQSESSSGKNESDDDDENTCRNDKAINTLISKILETSIEEGSTSETVPTVSFKKGSSSSSS